MKSTKQSKTTKKGVSQEKIKYQSRRHDYSASMYVDIRYLSIDDVIKKLKETKSEIENLEFHKPNSQITFEIDADYEGCVETYLSYRLYEDDQAFHNRILIRKRQIFANFKKKLERGRKKLSKDKQEYEEYLKLKAKYG